MCKHIYTYMQKCQCRCFVREKNIPELWLLAQKAETARAGAPLNPPDDSSWNAANDDGEDDDVDGDDDNGD